jgi:hypothetical protein
MEAIRLETTIEFEGRVNVSGIHVGDAVEVILFLKALPSKTYPLRGTPRIFPNPFEPELPDSDAGREDTRVSACLPTLSTSRRALSGDPVYLTFIATQKIVDELLAWKQPNAIL